MGVVFSWFRKTPSEDYENILSSLSVSISNRQTRLTELALRERRAALWAAIYTLAGWAVYTFIWYLSLLPQLFPQRTRSNVEIERVAYLGPVIIGPIAALFLRRIVQFWYRRKGQAEEATLKNLLAEQRKIIEEIKQKTNYYSTRNLLERYDNRPSPVARTPSKATVAADPPSQLRQRPRPSGRPQSPISNTPESHRAQPQTPITSPRRQQSSQITGTSQLLSFGSSAPEDPRVATPPAQPRRQWFDKVADALLGVDDAPPASLDPARSRYALICVRCSSHNGLVLGSLWEDTQYICPKCGQFNPAPRSILHGGNLSPDVRGKPRRLSETSDHEGRLPRPNTHVVQQSPKPSRSSSRASSKSGVISTDHPVDQPPPDPHRESDGSVSMEVDQ